MRYAQSAARLYRKVETSAVDQKQLLVLLYEGAVRRLREGMRYLEAGQYEDWASCSDHVRRILSELLLALDDTVEPKLTASLRTLYIYIQRLITEGGLEEDFVKLEEAVGLLAQLAEAWRQARIECMKQNRGGNERQIA